MTNEDYRKEITMLIEDIAKMLNSDDIFEVCEMKHSARNRICNIAEYRISILREKDM
ncbi:hypothetical protein [Hungatella effluvii]|uniref:hypothetical protein n=1 Tax=Hungatella effluvii TaxID=1096246 RepID=UPI00040D2791|nr:hypothetical protein [Hungatella effluvii]